MEDEKKIQNSNNDHHKKYNRNNSNRKKGYFIEPPTANDGGTPSSPKPQKNQSIKAPAPQATENSEKTERKEEKNQGNRDHNNPQRNNHQRNKQNNNRRPPQRRERPQADESKAQPSQQENDPVTQEKRNGNNHRNNNRQRNRHHQRNNSERRPQLDDSILNTENEKTTEDIETNINTELNTPLVIDESADQISENALEEGEIKLEEATDKDVPLIEVVGIRFKNSGKIYYFDPKGISYNKGIHAIVETARGLEYGEVALANTMVKETDTVPPIRPVVRSATKEDAKHQADNKLKEDEAFKICNEKIIAHKLDMKLIDVQYTFDNTKLLFYFTSAGRVDFRELVKDLASVFKTRIELRQIGIRDEAKLMGGLGMCGRSLCCSLFLTDFGQVSIKMAKEQNLSLNSAKISGICGRLMCCLRYEYETYEYEIKHTPPVDSLVKTADGNGYVTEINPLAGTIKVKLVSTPDTPPKQYHRDDVTVLNRKHSQEDDK